ncbi:hypothetical protein MKW98_031091 [Papaver atlanticum]|uniref:Fatty acyl-CoA reductase n=1 Tax=Papaver atlanticum TaxID=357466 RepID=A0AAD4SUU6_9MAGN|nr:hypothetical protein MKW98_031091 [Papaver atlanticum]
MELNKSIIASLENKCILVTGSTGFLAKLFVEKILRTQPNVKTLYLLIRATDAASATRRLHDEVTSKEIFKVIKETYGDKFNSFMSEKLIPVAGDTSLENLGIGDAKMREKIFRDVDVVVNFAATTKFNERYDFALGTNTLGPKNILDFSKKCVKLEMLLHVSTAYVCGEKAGLILEDPYKMGETLNRIKTVLDIEMEKKVIEQKLEELRAKQLSKKEETKAMKELGLESGARMFGWPNVYVFTKAMGEMPIGQWRENLPIVIIRPTIVTSTIKEPFPGWVESVKTVDSYFVGFVQGKIASFLGKSKTIMDVIPGDMVVNATIAAMLAHEDQPNSRFMIIYQVGSSNRKPMYCSMIKDYAYNHFVNNPLMSKNGEPIKVVKPYHFTSTNSLQRYTDLKYNLPLKGLRLAYAILRHDDGGFCNDMERQLKFVTKLAKLNEPYLVFREGTFDDSNTEKLRISVKSNVKEENIFYFDPESINWDNYFMNIHLPGLMTYVLNN